MRFRIISIAFLPALAGACVPVPHTRVEGMHRFVCIDGVEYLDDSTSPHGDNPTPHLKPDGKPYTCNY